MEPEARRDRDLIRVYVEERSEAAFAELRHRYARLIYATCLRETGDTSLAEDASQCVFLLLSQRASTLKRCDTIAGWLYSASRYVAKNMIKQERRRQRHEAEAAADASPRQEPENALWEQIEPHFHDALDRLKPTDREAVLLRFVQQQSFIEVGARLGISENTARMRVSRALEKVRSHLGRAGIAVAAGALAILLEEHSSQAAPLVIMQSASLAGGGAASAVSPGPASAMARRFALRMTLRSRLAPLAATMGLFALFYGYKVTTPQRVGDAERKRLFQSLAGAWSGTLEYADDRTHQHFTYPTHVVINNLGQGNALQLTATYAGTTNVDITTFTHEAQSDQFTMQNSGPQSSHSLQGSADLLRLPDGAFAFAGTNRAKNNQTRIRIAITNGKLTMQEEYRTSAWSPYQFRNRFSLQK